MTVITLISGIITERSMKPTATAMIITIVGSKRATEVCITAETFFSAFSAIVAIVLSSVPVLNAMFIILILTAENIPVLSSASTKGFPSAISLRQRLSFSRIYSFSSRFSHISSDSSISIPLESVIERAAENLAAYRVFAVFV